MDCADDGAVKVLPMARQSGSMLHGFPDAPTHLSRGRVRKGDRSKLFNFVTFQKPDVPFNEDAGFSASGARCDNHVAAPFANCPFLLGREIHLLCRLSALTRQTCFMAQ